MLCHRENLARLLSLSLSREMLLRSQLLSSFLLLLPSGGASVGASIIQGDAVPAPAPPAYALVPGRIDPCAGTSGTLNGEGFFFA